MELLKELKHRDVENCTQCNQGVAHNNNLIFYRVTIETYCLEVRNIQRQAGLEQMLGGNALLANVMEVDAAVATRVHDPEPKLICLPCLLETRLTQLVEG